MDIKELRNNAMRQQFLEERRPEQGWFLWLDIPEIECRYERVDIQGKAFICEVMNVEHTWPKVYSEWVGEKYYIIPIEELEKEGPERKRPFSAYVSSKTMCIDEIKNMRRRVKP